MFYNCFEINFPCVAQFSLELTILPDVAGVIGVHHTWLGFPLCSISGKPGLRESTDTIVSLNPVRSGITGEYNQNLYSLETKKNIDQSFLKGIWMNSGPWLSSSLCFQEPLKELESKYSESIVSLDSICPFCIWPASLVDYLEIVSVLSDLSFSRVSAATCLPFVHIRLNNTPGSPIGTAVTLVDLQLTWSFSAFSRFYSILV